MATITNGENGLSVRNKLNAVLEKDLISSTWSALQTAYPDGGAALLALPVGASVWVTDRDAKYVRSSNGGAWVPLSRGTHLRFAPIVFTDPLVTNTSDAATITLTGSGAPVGTTSYTNGNTVFDYVYAGTIITLADTAFIQASPGSGFMSVRWGTDAPDFYATLVNVNSVVCLFVDDVFAGKITTTASGSREYVRIQMGSRKPRRYRLEGYNFAFADIRCASSGDTVFRTPTSKPLMSITGDSYTQSTGADTQSATWAGSFARALGYDFWADGVGSTGWLSTGGSEPLTRLAARGQNIIKRRNAGVDTLTPPDVAFYALGYNDSAGNQTNIGTAVQAVYAACTIKPHFIGPWTPVGDTANLTTTATTIQTAATGAGGQFLSAQGLVTSTNKTNMTGGDNVHPTQGGHNWIGFQLAVLARQAGLA